MEVDVSGKVGRIWEDLKGRRNYDKNIFYEKYFQKYKSKRNHGEENYLVLNMMIRKCLHMLVFKAEFLFCCSQVLA